MSSLREALHDEIDEQEALADEARAVVDEAKGHFADLVEDLQDTQAALAAVAILVEDGLQRLAKKAVRNGYEAAKRRAKLVGTPDESRDRLADAKDKGPDTSAENPP